MYERCIESGTISNISVKKFGLIFRNSWIYYGKAEEEIDFE